MENRKPLEGMALDNYNLIVSYLDVIVLAKPTLDLLKTNADFQALVTKDITIVRDYEQAYEAPSDNSTRFANAYQAIIGKPFEPVTNINIDQAAEIKDLINYNPIFIKNITHLDFEQLSNSLNPQAEKVDAVETTPEQAQAAMAAGAVAGAAASDDDEDDNDYQANDYASTFSRLSNEATQQFIAQSAMTLLNYNAASGKVYIYKTKPKVIPFLKWITMAFYIILFIGCIVGTVFSVLAKGAVVDTAKDGSPITWNANSSTMVILQLVLICMIVFMNCWSIARTFKNENQKYKYQWGWNLFYVIILLMFGLLGIGLGGIISFAQNHNQFVQWNTDNGTLAQFKNLEYFMDVNYFLYAILGALIILIIVGACLNPQRDTERLQQLAQQYADQIQRGEIDPAQFNNGGGFMGSIFGGGF